MTFVCDGCMRTIAAVEVEIWADGEHVLCTRCAARERNDNA